MARTRSIKPSFFDNELLGGLSPLTRLLFIGLWGQADRAGRLEDRPLRLKKNILGYDDVTVADVDNIQGGTPVICMTMIDLLARVKQTFDRPGEATEAEIMRIYEEVPLLIIDDIGTEQPTTWGITQIYTIINARYEAYMPIIITTNYSGENLIRRMTPDRDDGITAAKTISRLTEMCSGIEMIWDDWRTK